MTSGDHHLINVHLVDPISTADDDTMLSLSHNHTVVSLRNFANVHIESQDPEKCKNSAMMDFFEKLLKTTWEKSGYVRNRALNRL